MSPQRPFLHIKMDDLGANPHENKRDRVDNAWQAVRSVNDCSKCESHLAAALKMVRVTTLIKAIRDKTVSFRQGLRPMY
jgi:hypothetical protein